MRRDARAGRGVCATLPRVSQVPFFALIRPSENTHADFWAAEMSASFFPGSTDMVQFWTRLGFVKKLELGPATQGKIGAGRGAAKQAPPSVWVERERQDINGFT